LRRSGTSASGVKRIGEEEEKRRRRAGKKAMKAEDVRDEI
jgi:hypothetical protein